jgi:hypothetical protein
MGENLISFQQLQYIYTGGRRETGKIEVDVSSPVDVQ